MIGASLLTRLAGLALVLAALAGMYLAHRSQLIQQGYDTAMGEVRDAQSQRLREALRETSRLIGVVKGVQDVYARQGADLEAVRARLRAADDRVRQQKADFAHRVAAATAASLRDYAQASEDNFERSRKHVERFGLEAAGCARTAEALKANLDALSGGSLPP